MTIEDKKALVRRFGDAMNSRQMDVLDELIAPDVVRHCDATPGLNVRSLAQLKDFLRQDAAVFPDCTQTLKHILAEGDLIAVWATYEEAGGKIAEWWVTWDNMGILGQLGHLPATPADPRPPA